MTAKQAAVEHGFGEATVTSKGEVTVPNDLRKALDISPGDKLRFVQAQDGSIRLEARKRRRTVDFARANAFSAGEAGVDLVKTIDEAIAIAMEGAIEEAVADDQPRHQRFDCVRSSRTIPSRASAHADSPTPRRQTSRASSARSGLPDSRGRSQQYSSRGGPSSRV